MFEMCIGVEQRVSRWSVRNSWLSSYVVCSGSVTQGRFRGDWMCNQSFHWGPERLLWRKRKRIDSFLFVALLGSSVHVLHHGSDVFRDGGQHTTCNHDIKCTIPQHISTVSFCCSTGILAAIACVLTPSRCTDLQASEGREERLAQQFLCKGTRCSNRHPPAHHATGTQPHTAALL